MAGVRRGTFTCFGWQVTLCDPIWQVTSHSSEMGFPWRAVSAFTFFFNFTAICSTKLFAIMLTLCSAITLILSMLTPCSAVPLAPSCVVFRSWQSYELVWIHRSLRHPTLFSTCSCLTETSRLMLILLLDSILAYIRVRWLISCTVLWRC